MRPLSRPHSRNPQASWLNNMHDIDDVPGPATGPAWEEWLVLVVDCAPNCGCRDAYAGPPTNGAYQAFNDRPVHSPGSVRSAILAEPDAVAAVNVANRQAATGPLHTGAQPLIPTQRPRWSSTIAGCDRATRVRGQPVQHAALGHRQDPSAAPGRSGLAAQLWIKPLGEPDGRCSGEAGDGSVPDQAEELIRNAPSR
jgi:hypothetical protein